MKKIILLLVIVTGSINAIGQKKADSTKTEKMITLKLSTMNVLKYTIGSIFDYLKKQPYEQSAPLIDQLVQLQTLVDQDIKSDTARKKK